MYVVANNIVPLLNFNKAIKNFLEELNLGTNENDIKEVKNILNINDIASKINHHINNHSYSSVDNLMRFYIMEGIHFKFPTTIMPYDFYYHKLLDFDCLKNICNRLIVKKLNATAIEIQQMSWKAKYLYETREDIKDLSHAVNIVIKTFAKGFWITPKEFPEDFYSRKNI